MQTEIKQTWFFSQSPNEVWEYLTKAELIAQWLMPNDFKPVVGHHFQFLINPIPSLGLDGIMHCTVLEIIPFKKLVYSWKAGPEHGVTTLDTVVTWTLAPKDNGTELHLLQSGFKEGNSSIHASMLNGWNSNVQKILVQLNKNNNASPGA